ncbi:MAG: hypothetical protein DHS20C01_19000 [marine bacterium B5-7]|nr:MAG: hypothetical protein DHS20C01_19000 [marine bacterium B5-7]
MGTEFGFAAAFMVGFLGSVHCIGMCGGIVGILSVGGARKDNRPITANRLANLLAYNAGRIVSYSLAGLLAGIAGNAAYEVFPLSRVAEVGMMLSGGFLILLGLYLADWWRALGRIEAIGAKLWAKIQPLSHRLLPVRSPLAAFPLGLLWGWLPCGLVYATLVWALFVADPLMSMGLMLFFGLGTLPMLLAMGTLADRLSRLRSHPYIRRTAGVLIIVFGVMTFVGLVHPIQPINHPVGLMCSA